MMASTKPRFRTILLNLFLCCVVTATVVGLTPLQTQAQTCDPYISPHLRFGINVDQGGGQSIGDYPFEQLGAGWYHNYGYRFKSNAPTTIDFTPMFRSHSGLSNLENLLGPTIDAHPGETWFVGNEPDRIGQDGIMADEYAEFYHTVYTFIKRRDPSAQIAFGGIVQPTPLRLEYLDRVVAAYNSSYGTNPPADVIHAHAFVMDEISWGAGQPPGTGYSAAPQSRTPQEQWDMDLFEAQIVAMRTWMKDNGYRQMPLIISEYGLLLPDVFHPNGEAESVAFLTSTFDYFLNETDSSLGYSADDNRLVQKFAWFSLNYPKFNFDTYEGLNGALFKRGTSELTALGQAYANYTQDLSVNTVELTVSNLQLSATPPISTTATPTVTVSVDLLNSGGVVAEDTVVTLWNGDPQSGGTQLDSVTLDVLPACEDTYTVAFDWGAAGYPTGIYDLYVQAVAGNPSLETNMGDNQANASIEIVTAVDTPTPEPTPTLEPTPMITPTQVVTPTMVVTPTVEPTAEMTPMPGETPTPGPTEEMTATPLPAITETVEPTAEMTPTPAETPTSAATGMPTGDPTAGSATTPEPTSAAPTTATATTPEPTSVAPTTPTADPEETASPEPTDDMTPEPSGTPTPEPTQQSGGGVPIVPVLPTSDGDNPVAVPTIPALYVSTKANPEEVTEEERQIVYQVSYGYALGDPIEDVTLSAEIVPNTRFVAEASDPRWICPESNAPGDICILNLGTLNERDRGSVPFVLEFIYPPEEEIAMFEAVMTIQVGDNASSRVTDTTEVMVQAQSSEFRILVPLIEKDS